MTRGRFIAFEGGEGAGKTTQIARLAAELRARGIEVIETREPGGTPGAEAIRALLVSGDADRWNAETEALLMNAARADHVARVVRPALTRGAWVLSDRYVGSTFAYQGAGKGVDIDALKALHSLATGDLWPDLMLVLDIDVETGLARAGHRAGSEHRFEDHDRAFHQRVRDAFLFMAQNHPDAVAVIDTSQPLDDVARAIWARVSALLED